MKRLAIVLFVLIPILVFPQRRQKIPEGQAAFGIIVGMNMAGMTYTEQHLSRLPQTKTYWPVGGLFLDVPLSRCLSVTPELLYVGRGMKTNYTHYSGGDVQYEIKSRYVDLRVPFLMGINVTDNFQPYIMLGVDAGWLLGGKIHLKQPGMPCPDTTIMIGKANMQSIRAGAFGGIGIRFFKAVNGKRAQFKIDATYHHDFLDSFTEKEHHDAAFPVNVNAYNINGKRFPTGIEIKIGIIIPIFLEGNDACYNFSRNRWRYY